MSNLQFSSYRKLETLPINAYPPNLEAKDAYHRLGRRILRQLARDLGLTTGDFDIRSNKGGIAVGGDITLHGEHIYVSISSMAVPSLSITGQFENQRVMYRSCKGRKDYSGGHNQWCQIAELTDPRVLEHMRRLAHPS